MTQKEIEKLTRIRTGEEACTCCSTVDSKEGKKPQYYSYRREKTLDPLNTGMMVVSFY